MLKTAVPKIEEMSFRQQLLADEETMPYNARWGGTIAFPKERWSPWFEKWVSNPSRERFYRYLYAEEEQQYVGEISYHFDPETGEFLADVIVKAEYRGKGYGGAGLNLLCESAKGNGLGTLCDNIALENPSVRLFLKMGFVEKYRTRDFIMVEKKL